MVVNEAPERVIFVGDLHGNIDALHKVMTQFPDHHWVFTGDLVDDFVRTRKEQLECVATMLGNIAEMFARCVWGNHDLQYVEPMHRCAGYGPEMEVLLKDYTGLMQKFFDDFIYYKDINLLVTHAGLCKYLYDHHGREDVERLLKDWTERPNYQSPLHWVGRMRGGIDTVGGIYWCDWYREFTPIPGLKQIFGHTPCRTQKIETIGENWNLDCLHFNEVVLEMVVDKGVPTFNEIFLA